VSRGQIQRVNAEPLQYTSGISCSAIALTAARSRAFNPNTQKLAYTALLAAFQGGLQRTIVGGQFQGDQVAVELDQHAGLSYTCGWSVGLQRACQ